MTIANEFTPHDGTQDAIDRLAADARNGTRRVQAAGSGELQNLIADVEDLVARVANLKDADVVRIRGKVENALASAKQSLASGTESVRRQARLVGTTADSYVRDNPWQAIGVAAMVGVAVGFLTSRRT